MTTTHWNARLAVRVTHQPSDTTKALRATLGAHAVRVTPNERGEIIARLTVTTPDADLATATEVALRVMTDACHAVGLPAPHEAHITMDGDQGCVDAEDLAGVAEAAAILNVPPARVHTLTDPARAARGQAFLETVGRIAAGPILSEQAVLDFAGTWRRKPGRIGRPRRIVAVVAPDETRGALETGAHRVGHMIEAGPWAGREVTLHTLPATVADTGDDDDVPTLWIGNTPHLVDDPALGEILGLDA